MSARQTSSIENSKFQNQQTVIRRFNSDDGHRWNGRIAVEAFQETQFEKSGLSVLRRSRRLTHLGSDVSILTGRGGA